MKPGEPDDGIEDDHFMTCPVCGALFDMRDLGQALSHMHDGPEMPIANWIPDRDS